MIRIESDWHSIDNEIDRISKRMPDAKMKKSLDTVLDLAFNATQDAVHVRTGSLKTSGRKSSSSDKARQRWVGTIEYGGPSASVNNPVDYAIYEKERDGTHDFFAPLYLMHPFFTEAIRKGLSRG